MSYLVALAWTVTDLGESGLLLSTAMAASVWFWLSRQRRLALTWLFCIGGCSATMVVLKLGFLTCGQLVLDGTIRTPSGHSAMAAFFYGAAALTAQRVVPRIVRHPQFLPGCAMALALAIGVSRVIVHAHTPQEVVAGLAVGFAWQGIFALILRRFDDAVKIPPPAILCLLVLLYVGFLSLSLAGQHFTVEGLLFQIADLINSRWGICTA